MTRDVGWIYRMLHIAVLILSIFLIVSISIDTFHGKGIEYYNEPKFLNTQLFICSIFMLDFVVELILSPRRGHYVATHLIFFIVSIPYLYIIHRLGWHDFSPNAAYLLQYIPLMRGGYALAIVVGWFTSSRASSLFVTYLVTLLSSVYFASLVFYMFERNVNEPVKTFADALWWAAMDMTTVGSNIVAVTPVGRVLSVLVAALGMMMFPIFTVYITSLITNHRQPDTAAEDTDVEQSGQ